MKTSVASALSLALLAALAVGCTAETAADDPPGAEEVSASEDALHARRSLVGSYFTETPSPGGLLRLALASDGSYSAKRDVSLVALCASSPCAVSETGTWSFSWGRLTLRAAGASAGERLWATRSAKKLTLRDARGSQELFPLPAGQCVSDLDCGAGEACPTPICLMFCEVNDPNCCGPRACEKVDPPAGEPCGPTTCEAGTECCNALSGLCVPPGMACTF